MNIKNRKHPYHRIFLVCILMAGFTLRVFHINEDYKHPDEPITVAVLEYLSQPGTWDTNWKNTGVEERFKYDQYNFSAYFYATYLFKAFSQIVPGSDAWVKNDNGLLVFRFFSVILATLVIYQTWRLGILVDRPCVALIAGALVAVTPLLVQDAHYARPEPFTTAITLAVITLAWPSHAWNAWKIFLIAWLIGILIATKVSMLALVWVPLVAADLNTFPDRSSRNKTIINTFALSIVGVALGFFIGAPGAVFYPDKFLNGVTKLVHQYSNLFPPHGHADGRIVADLLGGYVWETFGAGIVVACVFGIGFILIKKKRPITLLIIFPTLIFTGYFMTRSVFFERNLSHIAPLFCLLSAVGIVEGIRCLKLRSPTTLAWFLIGLTGIFLISPTIVTTKLVFSDFSGKSKSRNEPIIQRLRQLHPEVSEYLKTSYNQYTINKGHRHFEESGKPFYLSVTSFGDDWSHNYLEELESEFEMDLVAFSPSNYEKIPPCTLHIYHSSSEYYFYVKGLRPSPKMEK